MQRTTIMLPDELKVRAMRRCRQLGVSFGAFVREALNAVLDRGDETGKNDPLLADEGVFDGAAPADLAAEHDRHLYETER